MLPAVLVIEALQHGKYIGYLRLKWKYRNKTTLKWLRLQLSGAENLTKFFSALQNTAIYWSNAKWRKLQPQIYSSERFERKN